MAHLFRKKGTKSYLCPDLAQHTLKFALENDIKALPI